MRRVSYWPTPYEDELLFSIISRFAQHADTDTAENVIFRSYGVSRLTSAIHLPTNLKILSELTWSAWTKSPREIALAHTLFPYYALAAKRKTIRQVWRQMIRVSGRSPQFRFGIMAFSERSPAHLRYCLKCVEEDMTAFGETYWRRRFQLPFVVACARHQIMLSDSSIASTIRQRRASFTSAYELSRSEPNPMPDRFQAVVYEDIAKHLLQKWPRGIDAKVISERLNTFLQHRYGANFRQAVGMTTICRDFQTCFSEEFLKKIGLQIRPAYCQNWVKMSIKATPYSFSPAKLILWSCFLSHGAKTCASQILDSLYGS